MGNVTMMPQGSRGSCSEQIWGSLSNDSLIVLVGSGGDVKTGASHITLQYTKTTDQPGSGIWTPQGVPAVHYDDNEKVIGTWFGDTLYERVYDFSSNPIYIDTSYTSISAIDTTSIDKVIYCCAMHQDGTVYPAVDADPTRDSHTHMGLKSFDSHSNVAYVIIRYTKSSS